MDVRRVRGGIGAWMVLLAWLVFAGCRPAGEVADGARLRLTTDEPGPATSFELVLDQPVVGFGDVGMTSSVPPLVVDPPLAGQFVWRSRRSGLFRPDVLPQMGVTYVFTLRSGLTNASGEPIRAQLRRVVKMPSPEIQVRWDVPWNEEPMSERPTVWVEATSPMNPGELGRRSFFTDGAQRVGVEVEVAEKPSQTGSSRSPTWRERFEQERSQGRVDLWEKGALIALRPVRPLVSTSMWKLVLGAGVRTADGGAATTAPVEKDMGVSPPFEMVEVRARNGVTGGRQFLLRFNRPVDPAMTSNWVGWLRCEPAVADLRVERSPGGRTLAVSGAFELGREYGVTIASDLRSWQGPALGRAATGRGVFEPVPPSVWLQAFDAVQPASGARAFPLLAVNASEVRLRVKAVDPVGLIPTMRAYERYRRPEEVMTPDTVGGAALDYAALAGRTVLDTNIALTGMTVDEARRVELGWDGLVGTGRTGVFFVEADLHGLTSSNGLVNPTRVGPQALVQLTDLGLVSKRGKSGTWVWVFSQRTSRPVAGAEVSVRTEEDEELAKGTTDASGVVRLPGATNAVWMVASRGTDRLVVRSDMPEVSRWMFDLGGQELPDTGVRLLGFTDREAYQPGQSLHLKLLARRRTGSEWALTGSNALSMEVTGPRGDVLLRTNLPMTATGSAAWEWRLPEGLRGNVSLRAGLAGAEWRGAIEAREFQPPAFEVRVARPELFRAGEPLQWGVTARYLHGQALSRARVRWHVNGSDADFAPAGWSAFGFLHHPKGTGSDGEEGVARDANAVGEGVLTPGEPMVLHPELPPNRQDPCPQSVALELSVTDLNQQTVSETVFAVRHVSDFYLGFRWEGGSEAVLEAGRPLRFRVVAAGVDGTPWTNAVPVRARLRRVVWKSVAVQRAGHALGYERHRTLEEIATAQFVTCPVIREGMEWSATGEVLAMEGVKEPGEYLLELAGADSAGRPVLTRVSFHVAGDAHLAWHWNNGAKMDLVPSHADADLATAAGETFLVKAPFSGTALVTVEREDVRTISVQELKGNAPRIEVPFDGADSPNAFVGVFLVRGIEGNPHAHPMPEWRVGYRMVKRSMEGDRLRVSVEPGRPVLQPREEADVRVSVVDSVGRGVAGAEVTVYAVDEGYLQMKATAAPDPAGQLAEPLALGVQTGVSIPLLLSEDPALRSFSNKGHAGGGGGRSLMVRKNFEPCPYWNASLITAADGTVRVRFPVSDVLTRYRVVAVATEGAARMGTGTAPIEVRKPLMIESALPRYAHVGDRLTARAMVLNPGAEAITARVTVQPGTNAVWATGTVPVREVRVPAGGAVPVDFDVDLVSEGSGPWLFRVESGALSDAVSVDLPVTHPLAGVRDARCLRSVDAVVPLLDGMDPVVLENPEDLVVNVASEPLALIGEGVEQLLHYPYGCAEQTGSSLVPWLALRDRPELLSAEARDFDGAIREGVRRFWTMQTGSGGLAYWPGGAEPQRWASAYGAWILGLAKRAGADVDERRMGRLLKWLNEQWRSDGAVKAPEALHERCLTALALATGGAVEPALNQALLADAERLGWEDRALLAVALAESGAVADGAKLLMLPAAGKAGHGRFGHSAREAALRLLAAARCGVSAERMDAEVERILKLGRRGHWETTQGNAWVVWALAEHARVTGGGEPVAGVLRVGDRALPIGAGRPWGRVSSPLSESDLRKGVSFVREGTRPVWIEVSVSGRRRGDPARVEPEDRGFAVRRTYERLDELDRPGPVDRLVAGDRVLVTVQIDAPEAAEWVAVDDPVPSILEASVERDTGPLNGQDPTEFWFSNHAEIRGDRRRVFIDSLGEGRHRIRYLARVRSAGVAVAGPVTVEAMYQPQRSGHSAGVRLAAGTDGGR